jgi:FAD/FMN-containing dehydrogenase
MSHIAPHSAALTEFTANFAGQLLAPGDAGYDEARRVHNGLIDRRPALIARCCGLADVVDAVRLARELELEVAVRGGGHNVSGRATIDDGLMIDLSQMRAVHVDANARVARAQGGATWRAFNRETQVYGLATTGGVVSSTGVAGLTLGGGLGWLMSRHGLALDNLIAVDLVTADGAVIRASAEDHPDLFWAVRGGGGNFGVAASLEYRLHAVGPTVIGGVVAYPWKAAVDVLRRFRDIARGLPDDLMMTAVLLRAPDGSGTKLVGVAVGHFGERRAAEAAVRPLEALATPVMDTVGPVTYCQLNSMLDASFPAGALNYWKSHFLAEMSDQAIRTLVDCFDRAPSPLCHVVLEHFHGAATRVPVESTACALRANGFNLIVLSQWLDPADTPTGIAWAREAYATMQPFVSARRYVNYLGDDEPGDPVAVAYGPNLHRLREIKTKYDPDNFFHMNQNIRPL